MMIPSIIIYRVQNIKPRQSRGNVFYSDTNSSVNGGTLKLKYTQTDIHIYRVRVYYIRICQKIIIIIIIIIL